MPTTYHIPLKSLQPVHMKIIDLYLKCWKKKDIALELGVSCSTVSHTLKDPIAKEIIKTITIENLQKSMQHFSVQA